MIRTLRCAALFVSASLLPFAAACSGSSSGPASPVPANVPAGTGGTRITMAGTWEIRNASIVDATVANPAPPLEGTQFVIGPTSVVSIGGLSVAQTDFETFFGFPLSWYFNQADGNTLLFGWGFDRRDQGGTRDQVGVAGGTVDDNTISVESYNSYQLPNQPETYIRSRYTLVRVSNAVLAPEPLTEEGRARAADAVRALLGR